MSGNRPICVLIAALGGQGGGVLADWLVSAARIDGLQAQATSIPGVAQRTGATTYYFEVYSQRDLAARPVFSIFPASGAIDLMVSFEPMEAGRALTSGYISPDTVVITARERIYSTYEKIKPGDGVTPLAPVFKALEAIAGSLNIVAMAQAAAVAKCHPNAVMFGAMVASGVIPMQLESCQEAIRHSGVAVENNLAGFKAGMELTGEAVVEGNEAEAVFETVPDEFASAVMALPEPVRPMAGHAAARLLDYQDADYVGQYFERLGQVVGVDDEENSFRLSVIVARRLAAWMAFEDIMRVGQLKTRPGRLSRIRNELGIDEGVPLYVHDYLKPGRDELRGMLPKSFGKWMAETGSDQKTSGIAVKINTAGPLGWAMMRLLARLKAWRPHSARFADEQAMIMKWLGAVTETAGEDYELASQVVDLAVWARGYGDTRKHGFAQLAKLLDGFQPQITNDKAAYGKAVIASLEEACATPDN